MNQTPKHNYQLLTKRSERVLQIAEKLNWTKNIWLGVSVENEMATPRINDLVKTPASTKFLSCEPLIGPIYTVEKHIDKLDWIIVGGESGSGARRIEKSWVDIIKKVCLDHQVPFFFKQWGKKKFNINMDDPTMNTSHPNYAKGGCQLDGNVFREMPLLQI